MDTKELWSTAKELVGEEELSRRFRLWIGNLIRAAKQKGSNKAVAGRYDSEIGEILSDLNERAKRRFQASEPAKAMIIARIKEGATVQDFQRVHMVKIGQWYGDPKSESWIRPSTLYRPSHFWEYLAEWDGDAQKKAELQQKRQRALDSLLRGNDKEGTVNGVQRAERDAKVKELNAKKWNEHASWLDFMRWTIQFPDAESLEAYPMPERVRKMRKAPGMLIQVASGKVAEWAEVEYRELKQEAKHGKN